MYYNNKRLVLSIFWIILGVVLMWLAIAEVIDAAYWSGMGGALIAVGVLQVIRNLRYRNNQEYQEKLDIEYGDERNKYLRMMSWAWTGYIVVLIEAIGVVVALIMGQHTIQVILAYSVCLIVGIYWIVYMILKRKY
ncbi:MAG: hypothetical protein IJH60_04855 [Eubacterium sp.]|nr:hypothetical protein [Eubacterium sp.]